MTGIAFAADSAAGAAGGLGGFAQFVPLVLIFVVFYFLLIRPQQKQAKLHQAFLNDLKKGSKVAVEGRIVYRTFEDKKGVTKNITEIVLADFMFLDPAKGNGKESAEKQD